MKPETERWLELYEDDRRVAESALNDGVYRQCVYHSQQMVEKVLKAIWAELNPRGHPPKEHRLLPLAIEIGVELSDETRQFLYDLTAQYLPTRYADVMLNYSRERAEHYYRKAGEICQQLLTRLS